MQSRISIPPILWIVSAILIGLLITVYVQRSQVPVQTAQSSETPKNSELFAVPLQSGSGIDYTRLREALNRRDWEQADQETYEQLLHVAGIRASAHGFISQPEMDSLSCTDLRTIDALWTRASAGRFGFSAQEAILSANDGDFKRMYRDVGWMDGDHYLLTFRYDVASRRYVYDRKPDFSRLIAGSLPTVERGYNFKVSFDAALSRCGIQ